MVLLSFPPDICQGVFLEFDHEISLNFAILLETLMKFFMTAWFLGKTFFAPKISEIGKNSFNLKKNLVITFTEFVLKKKMFIICCVLAKILSLGKILFWGLGQNALSQSHYIVFK